DVCSSDLPRPRLRTCLARVPDRAETTRSRTAATFRVRARVRVATTPSRLLAPPGRAPVVPVPRVPVLRVPAVPVPRVPVAAPPVRAASRRVRVDPVALVLALPAVVRPLVAAVAVAAPLVPSVVRAASP